MDESQTLLARIARHSNSLVTKALAYEGRDGILKCGVDRRYITLLWVDLCAGGRKYVHSR